MNISSINFGKKIPLAQTQVVDKKQNKLINATIYEYDCSDLEDVYEVGDLDETWSFRDLITSGMHGQFLKTFVQKRDNSLHYYCAKDNTGTMLGLCQTVEDKDSINVKLIVSNPNQRYKYAAQSILATLGQKALNEDIKKLNVKAALSDVYGFYEDACGFNRDLSRKTDVFGRDYTLEKEDIPAFISRTKEKTRLN